MGTMARGAFRRSMLALALCGAAGMAAVAEEAAPRAGDVVVKLADPSSADAVGFGWSRAERSRSGSFRWMSHLEADVRLNLPAPPVTRDVTIEAQPFYLPWRQQIVGVYINHTFVGEFLCAPTNQYRIYTVTVPASRWKEGENLLTLRAGYREQIGRDTRDLALAVRRIVIKPRDD